MRTRSLAALLALGALAASRDARAWVVVRAPVYVAPMPVVYVAPAPVYVAPAPVYVAPAPANVAPPPPPAITTKLPVNTTMWTLPAGCTPMQVLGQDYYLCGVNWMKKYVGSSGTYYGVVAPP